MPTELEIEQAKRDMLYLSDGDKEAEFLDFLAELMRKPEHAATAELVWCKFTGTTTGEFRAMQAKMDKTAKLLNTLWSDPS